MFFLLRMTFWLGLVLVLVVAALPLRTRLVGATNGPPVTNGHAPSPSTTTPVDPLSAGVEPVETARRDG